MKKSELSENISRLLPENLTEEQNQKVFSHLVSAIKEAPLCNKCGELTGKNLGGTKVEVRWGYSSIGKDMEFDRWKLCAKCTQEFKKYQLICNICSKPIIEVMSDLAHRNSHSIFYGDYQKALQYYQGEKNYGLEYARISNRIVCEICYEDFIDQFKIPIPSGEYDPWDGELRKGEGPQRKNRIQEMFNFQLSGDFCAFSFEATVLWETAVKIRTDDNKDQLVISLSYRKNKPGYNYYNYVTAETGDGRYLKILVSWLEDLAKEKSQELDLTNMKITCVGQYLFFGKLRISSQEIIKEWEHTDGNE